MQSIDLCGGFLDREQTIPCPRTEWSKIGETHKQYIGEMIIESWYYWRCKTCGKIKGTKFSERER